MRGDLAGGQPFRIQRQHHLVDIAQAALAFLDDLRFERAFPIPWHINPDLAHRVGDHCFRPRSIAHIRGLPTHLVLMLRMPEVFGQFLAQRVSKTFLVNSFNRPFGPVSSSPRARASATIAAAAACSGDSCRPDS
jgi:hypothetical protein